MTKPTNFTNVFSKEGFSQGDPASPTPVVAVVPQTNPGAAPVAYDETYLQSIVDKLVAAGVFEA